MKLTLMALGIMINTLSSHNLSNEQRAATFETAKQGLIDKIQIRGDLPYATVEKQLDLVEQISQFELGKFLIERGGLNGYWTHYIITHPSKKRLNDLHPLEDYLLNRSPTCLATQQRFVHFKTLIQKYIKEGSSLASVPCGVMGDLLDLDYSHVATFDLHGIDLDPEALAQAATYAQEKGLCHNCHFLERDAWELGLTAEFDLLSSNGLAIYEPKDSRVVELYREFHKALKPGGILVTSFLTPPPIPGQKSEWKFDRVNMEAAMLQKLIFVDILAAKWQVYRTEENVKGQLIEAGFSEIEIFYDEAHIFPTVVAKKI